MWEEGATVRKSFVYSHCHHKCCDPKQPGGEEALFGLFFHVTSPHSEGREGI